MLTQIHFKAIADALRSTKPDGAGGMVSHQWREDVIAVARALASFNPMFSWTRFEGACGCGCADDEREAAEPDCCDPPTPDAEPDDDERLYPL
jgi:hypothetical protein